MAVFVKVNLPTTTEPQPQWLNQVRVTLAMGKRYVQKHELEKAANCFETVLFYDPTDTRTRVELSKCYQKMLQLDKAVKHQKLAMQEDPYLFQTAVNESSVNFELGNFESSLIGYIQCYKRFKLSRDCNRGLLKINQIMENTLPINGIMNCLGATLQKMIENDEFFKESTNVTQLFGKTSEFNKLHEAHIERVPEIHYLRYSIIDNMKFYEKETNDLSKSDKHEKLISEQMRQIVHTFKKAKNDLYHQNPLYMFPCQRPNYRLNDRQKAKSTIKFQVSQHVNTVFKHCLAGEIRLAQRQAELTLHYMNRWRYMPLQTVNTLYEVFGIALYLLNQDMPKWSDELNERRILYVLGSTMSDDDSYKRLYQESYFGPSHVYTSRKALKKLTKQIKETKLSTYKLYLEYERIKYYLTQNRFTETRPLSQQMFNGARTLGSIVWQVNSLMLSVICESRLRNSLICTKTLEFILPLSRTLGNKSVTEFITKILKLFIENRVKVNEIGYEETRRADLVDIMPDSKTASHMRKVLHNIPKLP